MPGVPPRLDSEAALEAHVRAERVRFAFIQSPLPMLFSPLAATTLCLALWEWANHRLLVLWAGGTAAIAIGRVLLVRAYPKDTPSADLVKAWERYFVASIVLVDLWWGLGALLVLPEPLAGRILVFSFVMLMAGGHAASYSAHALTVLLGVLALALPITLLFAFQGDTIHLALAFASVMYLAATFRSIRTLGYFFARSHRLAHDVQVERDRAERLARTDFLTGLDNRRALYEAGEAALRQAKRYDRDVAMLVLDIDHFKAINDEFGHAGGDAVLRDVAQLIRAQIRSVDIAGRLGGEEFVVLLPETPLKDALVAAERLRAAVGRAPCGLRRARRAVDGEPRCRRLSRGGRPGCTPRTRRLRALSREARGAEPRGARSGVIASALGGARDQCVVSDRESRCRDNRTKSPSVMMPTSVPSFSTTGTQPTRVFHMSRATLVSGSSGGTVTQSRCMTRSAVRRCKMAFSSGALMESTLEDKCHRSLRVMRPTSRFPEITGRCRNRNFSIATSRFSIESSRPMVKSCRVIRSLATRGSDPSDSSMGRPSFALARSRGGGGGCEEITGVGR